MQQIWFLRSYTKVSLVGVNSTPFVSPYLCCIYIKLQLYETIAEFEKFVPTWRTKNNKLMLVNEWPTFHTRQDEQEWAEMGFLFDLRKLSLFYCIIFYTLF